MKKMFYEDLPKKSNGKSIDWKKSIGEKVKFQYLDVIGYVTITDVVNDHLLIKYKDKEVFSIHMNSFKECMIGKLIGKITQEFKIDLFSKINDNNRNIEIIDREYRLTRKYYKYKCHDCGNEDWLREDAILAQKQGCNVCCKRKALLGVNTIWDTDRWMCDLGVSEEDAKKYAPQSNKKIKVICPDCGVEKMKSISNIYNNKSISCSCNDKRSYPSKFIHNVLKQTNINFDTEVKFNWCKFYNEYKERESYGIYDFVVKDKGLIIEVDGKFHRCNNDMNGQTVEESKFIDSEKDRLAKENGYEIIRIFYNDKSDNIRNNIINSNLVNYFDLSDINWLKCEEFALKNIIKEVCNYWNQKEEWEMVSDLERIFNVSNTTIRKYLKKGTKLGWTSYNPKEEMKKNMKIRSIKSDLNII